MLTPVPADANLPGQHAAVEPESLALFHQYPLHRHTTSVVRQHLAAGPPNVTRIRPAVPAAVAAALQRALAKTPADRFNPVVNRVLGDDT